MYSIQAGFEVSYFLVQYLAFNLWTAKFDRMEAFCNRRSFIKT